MCLIGAHHIWFLCLVQKKENADDKIAAKTVMEGEIATMEQASEALEKQRDTKLKLIGNLVHDSVPVSKNEVLRVQCVSSPFAHGIRLV